VAATNRNLVKMVARGQFRSDLYYRLNVSPILLPALRVRRKDIPALVTHFVKTFSRRMRSRWTAFLQKPCMHSSGICGPGNIRELQKLVERAAILSRDGVLPNPLFQRRTGPINVSIHRPQSCQLSMTSEDSDRALIVETLEQVGWVVGGLPGAAAKLGLKRTTLLPKMRGLGISRPIPQEGTSVPGVAQ
jgi:formate hydrogenlyase transcriptional activator